MGRGDIINIVALVVYAVLLLMLGYGILYENRWCTVIPLMVLLVDR